MKINDLLTTSIKNLWRRKVRTILTVIGVLIGSTSIIIMLSMGFALTKNNEVFFDQIGGMSFITVMPGDSPYSMYGEDSQSASKENAKLTEISLKKLSKIDGVQSVIPIMSFDYDSPGLMKDKYMGGGMFMAVDFKYLDELGYNIVEGTTPTGKYDLLVGEEVRRFGKSVGEKYVESEVNLLSDKIDIQYPSYIDEYSNEKPAYKKKANITGVLDGMGEGGYSIVMSLDYYKELANIMNKHITEKEYKVNTNNFSQIKVKVKDDADMVEVQENIKNQGFIAESSASYLNEIKKNTDGTRKMFLVVGAVAFIVAAIGIANTMIMSVYERTKEIGVMKVIGASLKDIRNMFLTEATFIGLIGGIISIAFSYLVSFLLNKYGAVQGGMDMFMGDDGQAGMLVSYIPIWLPFVGVLFSTLVGLLSGYLPSRRATKISAIEAIRDQ